ncbi:YIP1 family protein [Methanoregula sp.]|uniref:YIP1 family protein n=1 Tax=Methanoregula sp. TaxID=2052170 RepID=UPI003BB1A32B
MFDTVIARAKGLLMNPVGTFQASRDDTAKTVFSYFGVLLVFYALLSAIVTALTVSAMSALGMYSAMLPAHGMGFAVLMPVLVFVIVLIFCTIFTLVAGAWIHLLVWILGGKNGIMQTMKTIVYGMTPSLAFGWIPFIGFLFGIWSFILDIIGVRELGGLSTGKAALAMIIGVAIPLIILVYLIVVFYLPFLHSAMATTPWAGY